MAPKHVLTLLALALLAFGLAACELSASTPPPASPTVDEGPMGTLQSELGNIATQTAAAGGGGGTAQPTAGPGEGQPTGESGEGQATAEPTEGQQAAPTNTPVPPTKAPAPDFEPTEGIPQSYTLTKGEFPFCIARRFDVNQYELLNINGLGLNSLPGVGANLKIPQTGNEFAGERSLREHPTTYTVQSGDTLGEIACLFGSVSPDAIIQVNDLDNASDFSAGDTLQIP